MARNGSLRIAGGHLRGRKIDVPAGSIVRPMRTRVRESLFSIIQEYLIGARVLDVFAGSGALGIEAVSRGARQSVHVEKDRSVLSLLRKNLDTLGIPAQCKILERDAYRLPEGDAVGGEFDVILIDPPFPDFKKPGTIPWKLAIGLAQGDWLATDGILAIEHPSREDAATPPPGVTAEEGRRYGDTRLTIWRK